MSHPESTVQAQAMDGYLIGVDVGATKIAAGLGQPDGAISRRLIIPTVREDPGRLVGQVCDIIGSLVDLREAKARRSVVGIGICGQVDQSSGRVRSPIALGWSAPVPLGDMLRARSGLDVHIDNDVNAAALGEMLWGAARGMANFVYIAVGTGIGAGIVVNGQLVRGAHQAAGEIGHMIIDLHGPVCSCGNRGCLEVMAGGRDFAKWVRDRIASSPEGQLSVLSRQVQRSNVITAKEIFEAAAAGDAFSQSMVGLLGEYLAVAVVNLVNLLDPEKIIIGGGMTLASALLLASLREGLRSRKALLADCMSVLALSALGQDAGIVGAIGVAVVENGRETQVTQAQSASA